jgi:hypothetical protein
LPDQSGQQSCQSGQNIYVRIFPVTMADRDTNTRALTEFPRWMPEMRELPQIILQSGIIQDVGRGTRKECFDRFEADLQTLPLDGLSRSNPTL